MIEQDANAEILAKAGISPPSYQDAMIDDQDRVYASEKSGSVFGNGGQNSTSSEGSSSDRWSTASKGQSRWAERRGEKQAAKLQRKAEKAEEKAEWLRGRLAAQQRRV